MQNLPVHDQGFLHVSVINLNKMRHVPYPVLDSSKGKAEKVFPLKMPKKNYIVFGSQNPYEFITGGENVLHGQ